MLHYWAESATLHYVTDSAELLRLRPRRDTAGLLIAAAREWTAERGLAGFTVDELCEHVGVSRRTFFNHFAKKEHAVLGIRIKDEAHDAVIEAFLASTGPLVDALVDLAIARWTVFGFSAASHLEMIRVTKREPQLTASMFEFAREAEARDVELAARREGVPADDPYVATAVHLVLALMRQSGHTMLTLGGDSDVTYAQLLRERLDIARAIFSTSPASERN